MNDHSFNLFFSVYFLVKLDVFSFVQEREKERGKKKKKIPRLLTNRDNYCFLSIFSYLNEQLGVRPGFRRVIEKPQCTNTCFWYIPPSLRDQPETPEWWEKLSKVHIITMS